MGTEHVLRVEGFVELLLRHQSLLQHDVIDRAVGVERLLGHFTISMQRSLLTVMPSTHSSVSVSMAFFSQMRLSKSDSVMTGSITFSCNCPASAAKLTVVSLPITLKHT